jgi:CheY-like chemotaxis protein/two-component sensor histidine kinase
MRRSSQADLWQVKSIETLRIENQRKDEFIASLAHELRNPLAPLRAGIELLKRAGEDPVIVLITRAMMERQVTHLARLIDDLRDVSRIAVGKLELRWEQVPLDATLQSAVEASRPNLEVLEQLLYVGPVPYDAVIYGDATRLYEIFCNVLGNAIKYTPARGEIRVTTRRDAAEVVITVADTGIGIAADALPHVFEMFTQLQAADRISNGLGIGLALTRRLVTLHGGHIEVASEGLGRGTVFTIFLPLAAPARRQPSLNTQPEGDAPAVRRKILIADDDRDAALGLALLLEDSGHEVRTAADGAEAIAVCAEFEPAVVVLDIGMPVLDGYAVARRIRELPNGSALLLIAATGWGREEDKSRTFAAGFDHHFLKPIASADIERVISDGVPGDRGIDLSLDI